VERSMLLDTAKNGKTFECAGTFVVGVRTVHGTFLGINSNHALHVVPHCKGDEQFNLVHCGNGKVGLQSKQFGDFLSVDSNGKVFTIGHCKGDEQFTMENYPGGVGFKTSHGNYLSVDSNGKIFVIDHCKGDEQFQLVHA